MSPRTAFLLHPAAALHDTGWGHPEHQGRLRALASTVGKDMVALHGLAEQREATAASEEDALLVHTREHVELVKAVVQEAAARNTVLGIDGDTRVSAASWEAALGSLGATLDAVRLVTDGSFRNAFVATRPPGHHATPTRPMGFCLINHVACAARWLLRMEGVERVLIVDWDVHHGNGTQDAFWEDERVFYLSLHQSPHYPGTGRSVERGAAAGTGFTLNVELPAGTPADAYHGRYRAALDEVFGAFAPDFILVSAGFDCLAGDPLGGLSLEPADLHEMTRELMARADETCAGRLVACLEGGYDPERTGRGAASVIRALAGVPEGAS